MNIKESKQLNENLEQIIPLVTAGVAIAGIIANLIYIWKITSDEDEEERFSHCIQCGKKIDTFNTVRDIDENPEHLPVNVGLVADIYMCYHCFSGLEEKVSEEVKENPNIVSKIASKFKLNKDDIAFLRHIHIKESIEDDLVSHGENDPYDKIALWQGKFKGKLGNPFTITLGIMTYYQAEQKAADIVEDENIQLISLVKVDSDDEDLDEPLNLDEPETEPAIKWTDADKELLKGMHIKESEDNEESILDKFYKLPHVKDNLENLSSEELFDLANEKKADGNMTMAAIYNYAAEKKAEEEKHKSNLINNEDTLAESLKKYITESKEKGNLMEKKTLVEEMSRYKNLIDGEESKDTNILTEAWDKKMHTAEKDKGKWDNWTIEELKSELKKLKANPDKSSAHKKKEHQITFAIRAKQKNKWGKIKESINKLSALIEGEEDLSEGKTRCEQCNKLLKNCICKGKKKAKVEEAKKCCKCGHKHDGKCDKCKCKKCMCETKLTHGPWSKE